MYLVNGWKISVARRQESKSLGVGGGCSQKQGMGVDSSVSVADDELPERRLKKNGPVSKPIGISK
jgi:hypothetical protein